MRVPRLVLAVALLAGLETHAAGPASKPADLPAGAVLRLGSAEPALGAGVADYAYLPDGRVAMLAGGRIQIHDLARAELLATHSVSKAALSTVALRPDGQALLLTDRTGTVRQWDLKAQAELNAWPSSQERLCCAAYSPDAQRVITIGSYPPTLKLWDAQTGRQLLCVDQTGGMVQFNWVVCSPDGKTAWVCGGVDHVLEQYDLATGQCLAKLLKNYCGYRMELSSDGQRLLVGSRSYASEWELATGKELKRFTGHHGGAVNCPTYGRDPDQILTGSRDGSIRLWDRRKAEVLARWFVHTDTVQHLRVAPDGKWMLSHANGRLVETDLDSGQPRRPPLGHNEGISAAVLLPERRAASAAVDGSICVWDLASGKPLRTWQADLLGVRGLAAVCGGQQLAAGCGDGQIRFYATNNGALLKELRAHQGYIRAAIAMPGGNRLATSADDGCILVHDLDGSSQPMRLEGHQGGVLALAASPDGARLLSGGRDCSVRLWDARSGKSLAVYDDAHPGWVLTVCFSADGRRGYSGARDGCIVEWDLETGKRAREFNQPGAYLALACTRAGQLCAAHSSGILYRWDLATDRKPARSAGHRGAVLALALSPDTQQLLSASADRTLLLWDLK